MEYIPDFIKRKHGEAPIEYDHPMMEPYLKDTYGSTVYQEQVMLQSRALGNFTRVCLILFVRQWVRNR